ncbi:MAG: efflux RND transporter periplasmic adaptor subunit [Pseudomonadota bacterium]
MSKSYIWSAIFALAIIGWFGSGYILPASSDGDTANSEQTQKAQSKADELAKLFLVGVKESKAVERVNVFPVRGITEASRIVEVRARTNGIVEKQSFDDGDRVRAGDLLCQLDTGARKAQLARAKAALASARRDLDATTKLASSNFAAKAKVASDKAAMELAQAELAQIELDMKWTQIRAPIEGVLRGKPAQSGNYLQSGAMCATVHVMDPLIVAAQVPERLLPNVTEGMQAGAKLVTGEIIDGKITSIAMASDRETRTFRVELEVANIGEKLREGVTSELYINLPKVVAHKLTASSLTLSDEGKLGVRIVVDGNKVKFVPVKIVSQEAGGVWVTGLPETAMLIVEGQDFVVDGQTVEVAVSAAEAS